MAEVPDRDNPFQDRTPHIDGNQLIRRPQREAFAATAKFAASPGAEREVSIVLPVGCGKSGCIALTPFAFRARRVLVIAPGTRIATQLLEDFDPSREELFYGKCRILEGPPYPEPVDIRGNTCNRGDLDEAHVVVTNIQQLQGADNRWLADLPPDFFDLILFDEGHHSVADTYQALKQKFPRAHIVNFSATPLRADGQKMPGQIIYSYPIKDAIREGFVKRVKALVLNPRTLRYVRHEDGKEIEVTLDEVRRLGEDDADFRRSIVTSKETLETIVDASIRELRQIRTATKDTRHKIIASALNYAHCVQIVEAYRARGQRAGYVHSREDSAANDRVITKLEQDELDVIVQVRKLGEGFDHRYLSVAAVFSIFANLSPFVQFVGRIMRVIKENSPGDPLNQGTVVFHAGANIARRWEDFREYSEADQEYFDELLPFESFDFGSRDQLSFEPGARDPNTVDVREQEGVFVQELSLLDEETTRAIETLKSRGVSPEEVVRRMTAHEPIPTTKVNERRAAKKALDQLVLTKTGQVLGRRKMNHEGHELDTARIGKTNFQVVKSAIDKRVNASVGKGGGTRHEFSRVEIKSVVDGLDEIIAAVEEEVFGG